jgi:starvation-inducible DNA-binding protein
MILAQNLKVLLATSFVFYLKAKKCHWNVVGEHFSEYHKFFDELAEEVYGSIDTYAEIIRTLKELAPGSLLEYSDLTEIDEEDTENTHSDVMFERLAANNETILVLLKSAYRVAEASDEFDVSDFIAGRIAAHKKHQWMLDSYLTELPEPEDTQEEAE